MNHYDDLQRFQEKTRTQNLNFQDLSSQAATREHGDWAILNQLNPGAEKRSARCRWAPMARMSPIISWIFRPR